MLVVKGCLRCGPAQAPTCPRRTAVKLRAGHSRPPRSLSTRPRGRVGNRRFRHRPCGVLPGVRRSASNPATSSTYGTAPLRVGATTMLSLPRRRPFGAEVGCSRELGSVCFWTVRKWSWPPQRSWRSRWPSFRQGYRSPRSCNACKNFSSATRPRRCVGAAPPGGSCGQPLLSNQFRLCVPYQIPAVRAEVCSAGRRFTATLAQRRERGVDQRWGSCHYRDEPQRASRGLVGLGVGKWFVSGSTQTNAQQRRLTLSTLIPLA